MKTAFISPAAEQVDRLWYVIDAQGERLGRISALAASILRGKNKPTFEPSQENGDYVIIINAEKIEITGRKRQQKMYYHHTGYPGGIKKNNFEGLLKKHPTEPLAHAIKGMLPKGPLGRKLALNVKIYAGPEHPHSAQRPEKITLTAKRQLNG